METNFFGPMRMAQAFAPVLRDNGGGALVNVLSVLSFVSMPQAATYSASKAAAWSLTNALRMELRSQGTLVVAVHAGFIDTDMAAGVDAEKISPQSVADPDRRRHRSRRRGGARRPDQRDGQGGAGQRPDHPLPSAAGAVGCGGGQPMSTVRWKDVPTRTVDVGGTESRYRELGARSDVPVVFLHHFTAVLDDWDPRLIDGIAAQHRVIASDNRGVGATGGRYPHRRGDGPRRASWRSSARGSGLEEGSTGYRERPHDERCHDE